MQNKDIIESLFKGIATILMALCLYILRDFGSSLDNMQKSVNRLNVSFATMSEKMVNNTSRYSIVEKRLFIIEKRLDDRTKDRWTKQDQREFAKEIKTLLENLEGKIK